MEIFIAQIINGIAVGSMYALGVTGFNLLFLVGGVVQYAYPHIVVLSMYVCWYVLNATNESLIIAVPCTIFVSTTLNILSEPLFRPMVKRKAGIQTFVVSVGIAMIITQSLSKYLNRGMPISFSEKLASQSAYLKFGLVAVSPGQIFTLIGMAVSVMLFLYLLYNTMVGRAFRAMAQNPFFARLLGIPVNKTSIFSYGVAGLLGGITSIFLAMSLGSAYPELGDMLAIKVIAAVLFAGLGNLKGGLICALILGITEGLATGYLSGQWSNAVAFGMIMVVVILRPQGLFGAKT